MPQFVLGVDLQIQKVLGLTGIKEQLAGISVNTDIGNIGQVQSKIGAIGGAAAAIAPQVNLASQAISNFKDKTSITSSVLPKLGDDLNKAKDGFVAFGDQIFLAGKRYAAFVVATAGAFAGLRGIKQGIASAIEFESQLTILDQTMEEGSARIDVLRQKFLDLSIATGTSAKELAEVGIILAQAGLGKAIEGAIEPLSRVPLLPRFGDLKSTTEGLIAILNQFNLQGSDTGRILDELNAAAKKYAITSEDLIEGVKRGGGAFAATGGTLEEFIALFTTIRHVTQLSSETVGTSIKTISSRIAQFKTADFLKAQGIDTIDQATGRFVGLNNILLQVAERFDNLSEPRKLEFANQLGGLRQLPQILAAVKNPQILKEALQTVTTAGGNTQRDAQKALETTAKQFDILTAKVNELFQSLAKNTFLPLAKDLIKIGEAAVFVANTLSPLIPLIGAIGGVVIGRQLAGLAGNLASKVLGGTGGALGGNLESLLFGGIGQNLTKARGLLPGLNRPSGQIGGHIIEPFVRENPLIGVALTAALGTIAAQILKTDISVKLLGDTAANAASNFIQTSTLLVSAVALLRGQSITETIKGFFSGFGGGKLGFTVGALGVAALAGATIAGAIEETQTKVLDASIESLKKIDFKSLNFAKGSQVQQRLGLFASTFINKEGFQQFEKEINSISTIAVDALTVAEHILRANFSDIRAGIEGKTISDVKKSAAIEQFVKANLETLNELFNQTAREGIGNTFDAFVAGLQSRGVSADIADRIREIFEQQAGGRVALSARAIKIKIEDEAVKEQQRITRDLAAIIIPKSLTGDLIQFGKAVEQITTSVSASAAAFSAQIGNIQGLGARSFDINPTRNQTIDLLRGGGLQDLFQNQPSIPAFVSNIQDLFDTFDQFIIRISNVDLKTSNVADVVQSFFDVQQNIPPEVKARLKVFFNQITEDAKNAAGESLITPEELRAKFEKDFANLKIGTVDAIVTQVSSIIQSVFTGIQDRVNRLSTLRNLELQTGITLETQLANIQRQFGRVGIAGPQVGAGGQQVGNNIQDFLAELRRQQQTINPNLADIDARRLASDQAFFRSSGSQLVSAVLDPIAKSDLVNEFKNIAEESSALRNSLQQLKINGQEGGQTFLRAAAKLEQLEKRSVEVQAAFEALSKATQEARSIAVEELKTRQEAQRITTEARVQQQVQEGIISPLDAQKQLDELNRQQREEQDKLNRQFQGVVEQDAKARLEVAQIIDKNTTNQADIINQFGGYVAQFGQAILPLVNLNQAAITTAQPQLLSITPEQIKTGAVTPEQALQAINDAVTKIGNSNSDAIQAALAALREVQKTNVQAQEKVNQPNNRDQQSSALIDSINSLSERLNEPGQLQLTADQNITFDLTGISDDIKDQITPLLQEAAQKIATIITKDALESLAAKTDTETSIAIQSTVRELNT